MKKLQTDFDEVIAETTTLWIEFFFLKTGIKLNINDLTEYHHMAKCFGLTDHAVLKAWNSFYTERKTLGANLVDGCWEVLNWWVSKGNIVEILTSRPAFCQDEIAMYLKNKKLDFITTINCCNTFEKTGSRKKSEVFLETNSDFFVEDTFSNAVDVASCAPQSIVFLLDKTWNQSPIEHTNIIRVSSWYKIKEHLENYL